MNVLREISKLSFFFLTDNGIFDSVLTEKQLNLQ